MTIITAIVATALSPIASAQTTPAGTIALRVDAGMTIGRLKPLDGVNGAPNMTFLPQGSLDGRTGPPRDVSAGYREAGVTLVRTHDSQGAADIDPHGGSLPVAAGPFGPPPGQAKMVDMNVIFPDLAADPDDARSYRFGPTDQLLEGIHAIGAETMFRLGRSGMTGAPPPTDLPKYAAIVRPIVMHYNKGWANGYRDRVKYWGIWNEPDLGQILLGHAKIDSTVRYLGVDVEDALDLAA